MAVEVAKLTTGREYRGREQPRDRRGGSFVFERLKLSVPVASPNRVGCRVKSSSDSEKKARSC